VPWCETCSRFLSPSTVHTDGSCPTCGRPVDAGNARAPLVATETESPEARADDHPPIPWHLWLLVIALVIYLGFRAWQGIELLL
jgi:hypothetical protein